MGRHQFFPERMVQIFSILKDGDWHSKAELDRKSGGDSAYVIKKLRKDGVNIQNSKGKYKLEIY